MDTSLSWLARLTTAPAGADWRHLLDAYGPLLRAWAGLAGVPGHDHDDLVQEVVVVVFRRVGEFECRGPGAFRAWLRGILANHLRAYFRTRPTEPAVDLAEVADPTSHLGRLWDRQHDEHLAAGVMRRVEGDFAPATWAAFLGQVFDGRSAAEVAAELGLSVNSALLAKSRVLKRLRVELAGLI